MQGPVDRRVIARRHARYAKQSTLLACRVLVLRFHAGTRRRGGSAARAVLVRLCGRRRSPRRRVALKRRGARRVGVGEVLRPGISGLAPQAHGAAPRADGRGANPAQRPVRTATTPTIAGLRPAAVPPVRACHQPAGTFTTGASATRRSRFAITGDADATPGPNGRPGFNGFETYGRWHANGTTSTVELGDTIYSDSELAGRRGRAHRQPRSGRSTGSARARAAAQLRAAAGLYSGWDDHEFVNDFSARSTAPPSTATGVRAFLDYTPATYRPQRALPHVPLGQAPRALLPRSGRRCSGARRRPPRRRRHRADSAERASAGVRRAPAWVGTYAVLARAGPLRRGARPRATRSSRSSRRRASSRDPSGGRQPGRAARLPRPREGASRPARRARRPRRGAQRRRPHDDTHAHLIGEIRSQTFAPGGPVGTGIWERVGRSRRTRTRRRSTSSSAPGSGRSALLQAAAAERARASLRQTDRTATRR